MGNKTARPNRKRNQSANHFEEPEDLDQASNQKMFFTSSPKNNMLRKRMQRNSVNDPRDVARVYTRNSQPLYSPKLTENPEFPKEIQKEASLSTNLQNSDSSTTPQNISEATNFHSNPFGSFDVNLKIEETKAKIRECDEEIKNLESSPSSSTSNKLLWVSKMRRDQLNKFADQLILKQYYLDKSKFETSLPIRAEIEKASVVEVRTRSKTPTFRDILRQQRKSQVMVQKVGDLTEKLVENHLDAPEERLNRHQVTKIINKTPVLKISALDQDINPPEEVSSPNQPSLKSTSQSKQAYPTLSPLISPSNELRECLTSRAETSEKANRHFPLFPSPKSLKKSSSIPWYLKGTDYDKAV